MEIVRVENNTRESLINNEIKVRDLPKGLRIRVVKLLNKLNGVIFIISFHDKKNRPDAINAILRYPDRNSVLNDLPAKIKKEFEETTGLLEWYFREHWYSLSPRGTVGAPRYCIDCQQMVRSGHSGSCPNNSCPSHLKWRRVIGPSYEMPPRPVMNKNIFFAGVSLV